MIRKKQSRAKENHHFLNYNYIFFALVLILWQIISSIAPLPMLEGFFFCYMAILLHEKEETLYDLDFRWYFSCVYLLFIDITHDLYLFTSWLSFGFFYYFFAPSLRSKLKLPRLLPVFFTISAYLLVFITNNIIAYIDNSRFLSFKAEFLVQMLVEGGLCYLFFRGKFR